MVERRKCAKFSRPEENCECAKVVEVKGYFPVTTFNAKVKDNGDLTGIHNVKSRIDDTAWEVYCTHPECPGKKEEHGTYVGNVEPYFDCFAPDKCPKIQPIVQNDFETKKRKKGFLERIKEYIFK